MSPADLRTVPDRIRQTLLYETGGLIIVSPLFSYAAGVSAATSTGLLAVLAMVVGLWTTAFNTLFDAVELRRTGIAADQRPPSRRILHATLLEGGAIIVTTPVIAVWMGIGWLDAFAQDIGLTLAYAVYAFFFGLAYDRVYPLGEVRHG